MITITIKTDNAAFQTDSGDQYLCRQEVARILRTLADRLTAGERLPENLRDVNGNHVGNVIATGKDRRL